MNPDIIVHRTDNRYSKRALEQKKYSGNCSVDKQSRSKILYKTDEEN